MLNGVYNATELKCNNINYQKKKKKCNNIFLFNVDVAHCDFFYSRWCHYFFGWGPSTVKALNPHDGIHVSDCQVECYEGQFGH